MRQLEPMHVVEEWLSQGPTVAPDGLLAAVSAEVRQSRQVAGRPLWEHRAFPPIAAVLALLAVLVAAQLIRPFVGDETPTPTESELLRDWPNQPDWFVNRDPLPFCGEALLHVRDGRPVAQNTDARRCLYDAYRSSGEAEYVEVVETTDGPYLTVVRVRAGSIEEYVDNTPRGSLAWHRSECRRMTSPIALAEELPIHGMTPELSDALVFIVDPTSCTDLDGPPVAGSIVGVTEMEEGDRLEAYAFDSVWVVNQDRGLLKRIDPDDGGLEAQIDIGRPAGDEPNVAVAADADVLWVTVGRRLLGVDPDDNAVVAERELHAAPHRLAVEDGLAWITAEDGVLAVQVESGVVVHRISLDGSAGLAIGLGAVWANSADGAGILLRIDPASGDVLRDYRIGADVHELVVGEGAVYGTGDRDLIVLTPSGGYGEGGTQPLVRLDPETGDLMRLTTDSGYAPPALGILDGGLWAVRPGGLMERLDPRTLVHLGAVAWSSLREHLLEVVTGAGSVWVMSFETDPAALDPDTVRLYRVEPTGQ
jgi:streptogramin lyase